jgi:hemin uptake protein HemP
LNPPNPSTPVAATASQAPVGVVESERLFQGGQEVVIRHAGTEYRLRITRQNKLILTK